MTGARRFSIFVVIPLIAAYLVWKGLTFGWGAVVFWVVGMGVLFAMLHFLVKHFARQTPNERRGSSTRS